MSLKIFFYDPLSRRRAFDACSFAKLGVKPRQRPSCRPAADKWPALQTLIDSTVGYYLRPGGHSVTAEDWWVTLDWADRHLASQPSQK